MNPYRVILTYQRESQSYRAKVLELEHCEVEAPTRQEALTNLEEELSAQLDNMKAQGGTPPEPIDDIPFEGTLPITLSATLFRELLSCAKIEKVELNDLIVELLSRGMQHRWVRRSGQLQEPSRRRFKDQPPDRYHDIMENRADFIEYVRNLESNNGGRDARGNTARRGRR